MNGAPESYRGARAKLAEIQPRAFQWEELAGLLPRRQLKPAEICRAVRERLGAELAAMTTDESALVADARHHRLVAVFQRLADEASSVKGSRQPHSSDK